MDGHGAQMTRRFQERCRELDIIPIYTPPNCTDVVAPVDAGCGATLKSLSNILYQADYEKNHNIYEDPPTSDRATSRFLSLGPRSCIILSHLALNLCTTSTEQLTKVPAKTKAQSRTALPPSASALLANDMSWKDHVVQTSPPGGVCKWSRWWMRSNHTNKMVHFLSNSCGPICKRKKKASTNFRLSDE